MTEEEEERMTEEELILDDCGHNNQYIGQDGLVRCLDCDGINRPGVGWVFEGQQHVGHWSIFGTYWCDTCNSPYCELA